MRVRTNPVRTSFRHIFHSTQRASHTSTEPQWSFLNDRSTCVSFPKKKPVLSLCRDRCVVCVASSVPCVDGAFCVNPCVACVRVKQSLYCQHRTLQSWGVFEVQWGSRSWIVTNEHNIQYLYHYYVSKSVIPLRQLYASYTPRTGALSKQVVLFSTLSMKSINSVSHTRMFLILLF